MTTNIGSPVAEGGGTLGFTSIADENAEKKISERAERIKRLRESFRPELVNRIDEIIVFDRLSHDDIVSIAQMMIREVEERITTLGITAQFDPSVAEMLASCESVKTYGARPLRREDFLQNRGCVFSLDARRQDSRGRSCVSLRRGWQSRISQAWKQEKKRGITSLFSVVTFHV